jgi:diguanylate cyclase (GGDEF)-like protein
VEPYIYLNTAAISGAVVVLLFIDYLLKYTGDFFQRRIFLGAMAAALGAVAVQLVHFIVNGNPGAAAARTLYAMNSSFYVFQNTTYYLIVIFIDYITIRDRQRSVRFLKTFAVFMVLYVGSVVLNLFFHFYFFISTDNYYVRGPLYSLRLFFSYLPILLIITEMILRSEYFKKSQVLLTIFFSVITGLGTTLDILLRYGNLSWPCYAGGVLYIYFFTIQADTKIDSLTGLANRFAFNEFINTLEGSGAKKTQPKETQSQEGMVQQAWFFLMIDLVRLRKINDTLGRTEGDNALRDMAVLIKRCIRESDFAARYGGDEFVVAAGNGQKAEPIIKRIQAAIKLENEKNARPYLLEITYAYDVYTTGSGRHLREFLEYLEKVMNRNNAAVKSGTEET